MRNLERILKHYESCSATRHRLIKRLLLEFEEKGSLHHSLSPTHSLLLTKDERKCKGLLRKYEHSPFPYLSNVEYFCTAPGSYNETLLTYGIKARSKLNEQPSSQVGSQIHLLCRETLNYRCNQYLRKQYKRLASLRHQHEITKYWNLSYTLMTYSWSYRLACLNNWQPSWYKSLSVSELTKIWQSLHNILSLKEVRTNIRNVWIESPKGKWRQLCIANKGWRLYLHMLNQFLTYIYEPHLPSSKYDGFIFSRGCKSWWTHLLWSPLLSQTNWLMELDVSSGFPNINLHSVRRALLSTCLIPEPLVNLLLTHLTSPLQCSQFFPTLLTFIEHHENLPWRSSSRSLPMGLGISPILFVITLDWAFKELKLETPGLQSKWYADDFSFYFSSQWFISFLTKHYSLWTIFLLLLTGTNPLLHYLNTSPLLQEVGIKICTKKSSFVRILGLWIKPYQSLGLSLECPLSYFHQITRLLLRRELPLNLRSNTRGRGENLLKNRKSTPPRKFLFYYPSSNNSPPLNLSELITNYRPYFGLFLSKLYGGDCPTSSPSFRNQIKGKSPLSYLLPRINKYLLPLDKFNEYNSGSKLNKLFLSLQFHEPISSEYLLVYPNLKRDLKPQWPFIPSIIPQHSIEDPLHHLAPCSSKDYFKKYSELNLSSATLEKYETLYKNHSSPNT
jgi:hypothetical protein